VFRVAVLITTGTTGKSFDTREQADEWLLSMMDKHNIKKFRIKDLDINTVIETERGRRDKKEE